MHSEQLLDVLILLAAAAVLGMVCERFRQNAILGYLTAGTLFAAWMEQGELVHVLAELGVAMLLFTIGLEFSYRRLISLGAGVLMGGVAQVVGTIVLVWAGGMALGLDSATAVALGAMIALSSTACVLRVLLRRAELDSIHGRTALAILLIQDMALVPLVILVANLGGGSDWIDMVWTIGNALWLVLGLMIAFFVMNNLVMVRLLRASALSRNRELPILLATVICLAAAWSAQSLGLSPALGAFGAGMMMAETPFATQVRADVGALKTLFVTLFFTSVGMLADLGWIAGNWALVLCAVAVLVVLKALVVWGALRLFGRPSRHSLAAGVCLAQVGEFSFVLAELARKEAIFSTELYNIVISSTIFSLFLTPALASMATRISQRSSAETPERADDASAEEKETDETLDIDYHVIVVGFGPASRQVLEALEDRGTPVVVVDINPRNVRQARKMGLNAQLGDATHDEVLEHLNVEAASAVVVTLPDHRASAQVIRKVSGMSSEALIVARARFDAYQEELLEAGADVVLDEEFEVGRAMAEAVLQQRVIA